MKRLDLIAHLARNGCELFRQGGNHSIYVNRTAKSVSAVPRHREINEFLIRKNPGTIISSLHHYQHVPKYKGAKIEKRYQTS